MASRLTRLTLMAMCLAAAGVCGGSRALAQTSREAKPQMKGMELYSWQEESRWRFSLLPGTNRTKSVAEILSPEVAISTVAKLKERLARLAPGEHVSWRNPRQSPFAYPGPEVACDLVAYCERLKITLDLGKPCRAA